MSQDKLVLLEPEDKYYLLTLNNPDKLNSLSDEMVSQLETAIQKIEADKDTNIAIITGAGRAFCAGADIKAFNKMEPPQAQKYIDRLAKLFLTLRKSSKIYIAAVNGYAVGGGAELMLNCDLVYISDQAKIGFPEIKLGLIPGATGTSTLASMIGKARAKDLLLNAKILTSDQAAVIGLVNQVFPGDKLLNESQKIASHLDIRSPQALKSIKATIEKSAQAGFDQALALERKSFIECFDTGISRELRRLFEQKS